MKQLREQLDAYREFKTEHMLLSKRERLMKTSWRHGVVGIDDADSKST